MEKGKGLMNQKKILLIEQKDSASTELTETISYFGYEVIPACSGNDAIEKFSFDPAISMVVIDTECGPGTDVPNTANALIKHRKVPIIFWTTETDRDTIKKIKRALPYGHIIKKSEARVLLSFIEMAYEFNEAGRMSAANV
jgi:DNA-binding NtrC family response regulator